MLTTVESPTAAPAMQTLYFHKERQVAAPIATVFQTILKPLGPLADLRLKLEPWPGGRWYRDLGDDAGHLWGLVQVIKPPKLLEIAGPMCMSYAVASHLQYRLVEAEGGTHLTLTHSAIGLITREHQEGMNQGWDDTLDQIKAVAEQAAGRR